MPTEPIPIESNKRTQPSVNCFFGQKELTMRQELARGPRALELVSDFFQKGASAKCTALMLEGVCLADAEDTAPNVFKDKRDIAELEALLTYLGLCRFEFEEYVEKEKKCVSLYVFLQYLKSLGFVQAEILLDMVHDTTYRHWLTALIAATGSVAGVTTFFYLEPDYLKDIIYWFRHSFPETAHWFKDTYLVLNNIPLLGAIGATVCLAWSIYWIAAEPEKRAHDKKRWVMFAYALGRAAVSISGYVWWYLRQGGLPRFTIAMFIVGSIVDVVEVIHTFLTVSKPEEKDYANNLMGDGQYWRDVYRYRYACDEMYAKLAVAVLSLGMTIVLCFLAHSLVLSVGFVLIGWGLNGMRGLWLQHRDHLHKNALQDEILHVNHANKAYGSTDNRFVESRHSVQRSPSSVDSDDGLFAGPHKAHRSGNKRSLESRAACKSLPLWGNTRLVVDDASDSPYDSDSNTSNSSETFVI